MKTIYIDFDNTLVNDNDFIEGLKKIIKRYENKVMFITNSKSDNKGSHKHSQIKIFYDNNNEYEKYINEEVLVVTNWDEVESIVDFYLKYDYETLERII